MSATKAPGRTTSPNTTVIYAEPSRWDAKPGPAAAFVQVVGIAYNLPIVSNHCSEWRRCVSTAVRREIAGAFTQIERTFALQQAHQWDVKASTAEQRKEKLRKLKSAVEAHGDEIVAAVKQDTRKPENEIRVTELLNVIANIDRNINNLEDWMKPVEVSPALNKNDSAEIVSEARGVCLILGPWNFPLGLAFGPLAAAVAAGKLLHSQVDRLVPRHRASGR